MASSSSYTSPNPFPPSLHRLSLNLPQLCKFKTLRFAPNCSSSRVKIQTNADKKDRRSIKIGEEIQEKKNSRKPRPSFNDQIAEKWSRRPIISTNVPWHREQTIVIPTEAIKPVEVKKRQEDVVEKPTRPSYQPPSISPTSKSAHGGGISTSVVVAPWMRIPRKVQFDSETKLDENFSQDQKTVANQPMKLETESSFDNVREMNSISSPTSSSFESLISEKLLNVDDDNAKDEAPSETTSYKSLPWERMADSEWKAKKGNAELAEKTIPEHQLKRLRNVALRMLERIKVGEAGVTQAVVDEIHERWKIDEVVKLKFEGSPAFNMRRVHETLERKTGGLVIWRSGSSVVLYKGMNYKLDCVQSYNKQKGNDLGNSEYSEKSEFQSGLSEEELMGVIELQNLLDDLGPRFEDWTGIDPKPVDADLLPGVIPGYKSPFRLLPYGMRQSVRNKEMTFFRQQARRMRPHFALGRNRELEGLAQAMVKLWEKSAIAKIAIKRGVRNTYNDKMAEDLKRLTGGTLLSRNKEFIVFYRGNDFLPRAVTESLKEREKLTGLLHQEEEAKRDASLLIDSTVKTSTRPPVAGTLDETIAATSRWGKQANGDDLVKMLKDSAIARHASLVNYLKNKLSIAKMRLYRAEKALAKVQAYLHPSETPSDQEMITDEERFLLRKMGLSMKPFLLLGRRGVFDGTVQNMHLHWKFRELVKIIVRGKSYAQVKHIAIDLEAESNGVFVSIDRTTKGFAIIIYRGKNYQRPLQYKPRNLLTRRQALARSIELQRREAIKHHMDDLVEKMELIKSELDDMKNVDEIDDKTLYEKLDGAFEGENDDKWEEDDDDDEEAYLEVYDNGDDDDSI